MITERAVNRLANAYRSGAARPLAYLEHAQEHFLRWMDQEELFTEEYGTGGEEYCGVTAAQLGGKDDIGALAKPVIDWQRELKVLCDAYGGPIGKPGGTREERLAKCDVADKWWYETEVKAFVAKHAK